MLTNSLYTNSVNYIIFWFTGDVRKTRIQHWNKCVEAKMHVQYIRDKSINSGCALLQPSLSHFKTNHPETLRSQLEFPTRVLALDYTR